MKIEQLLVQHLYNSKEVTLQGIGTFRLNPQVSIPADDEKDYVMPENAIHFEYNLKATEDEGLINYIVQHTRKIKPLASSDLDSYVTLSKQFLNIGKPLVIEGIGTVQKNQLGEYEFIPGNLIPAKTEEAPNQFREKKEEEAVSFRTESNNNKRRMSLAIPFPLILLFLVVVGLIVFYFVHKKSHVPITEETPIVSTQPVKIDTVVKKDTTKPLVLDSSLLKSAPIVAKDSFNFKIVIKEYYDSAHASNVFKKLTGYGNKLILFTTDSLYKLAMPFMTPLSDTTRAKDSLAIFFKAKTKVEL